MFHHLFCLYAFMQHATSTREIERYDMQIYAVVAQAHSVSADVSVVKLVYRNTKEANADPWQFRRIVGVLLKIYLRKCLFCRYTGNIAAKSPKKFDQIREWLIYCREVVIRIMIVFSHNIWITPKQANCTIDKSVRKNFISPKSNTLMTKCLKSSKLVKNHHQKLHFSSEKSFSCGNI